MKRILLIVIVIILFTTSILIFWAGLSPKTFSSFFSTYPEINKTANQFGILKDQTSDQSDNTVSEPVLGAKGEIIIKNNTWKVEIADNEAERVNGLSNRKVLYKNSGLLFAFDKMGRQNFWMKDMLIPIDMIFFDSNWKIVLIESNLQPNSFPKIFGSGIESQYVLEVNALEANSFNLTVGDQAIFLNI
jgi:uncharacterized protein